MLKRKGSDQRRQIRGIEKKVPFAPSSSAKNSQRAASLEKAQARKVCESLSLLDDSRLGMAEKEGRALLRNSSAVDGRLVLLVGEEDSSNEAANE